jgi:hypothetical protein
MALNEFKEFTTKANPANLFSKLFEARDFAHFAHLKAAKKSYAEHIALGDFYDKLTSLADEIYETYAGQYGIPALNNKLNIPSEDAIEYLGVLGKELIDTHTAFDEKDTHLHNILDEIVGLVYHTLYKLKFLK